MTKAASVALPEVNDKIPTISLCLTQGLGPSEAAKHLFDNFWNHSQASETLNDGIPYQLN
jgi:hypothetical protein